MRAALLLVTILLGCAEQGPTGPKGDMGPKGDIGAPGMPGMNATVKFYSVRAEKTGVGPSTMKTPIPLSVSCDAGDVATSGACWVDLTASQGGVTGAPIVEPPNAATGWNCDYDNGWSGVTVTATVLCASSD